MEKTYVPKASDITTAWYLVDAREQSLGRLATKIASVLLGKNEPSFTPGVNLGNHVVVINAEQITVTGKKMEEKMYYRHSQYPGGLKSISLRKQLETHPDRVLKSAVWGMLPHNKLGKRIIKNLKVYAGSDHPHQAQQPKVMA
ncbi:MAG: 50S ribosomal protein L13 [Chloroflexi bacterium RBG_16_52_11]|nr:MAG: 50S ribosomal protein L13 [Chloroflexi bacterium RBG_16_52_11]